MCSIKSLYPKILTYETLTCIALKFACDFESYIVVFFFFIFNYQNGLVTRTLKS